MYGQLATGGAIGSVGGRTLKKVNDSDRTAEETLNMRNPIQSLSILHKKVYERKETTRSSCLQFLVLLCTTRVVP